MKKIAIHINEDNLFEKKWVEIINSYEGYEAIPVNMKSYNILNQVKLCDGVMWHYLHSPLDKQAAPKILTSIEFGMGKQVWPNFNTRWFFDEKVSQHYFLTSIGVKSIPSWVFWSYDEAEDFLLKTQEYPLVFKLSVGAGSANVIKINSVREGIDWLNKIFYEGIYPYTLNEYRENYPKIITRAKQGIQYLFKVKRPPAPWYYQLQKDYFYIQKFIPNNQYDIRITIIGNRAFGFTRSNRDEDFRASGSGKINWDPELIPNSALRLAFDISNRYGFQSMAYDFLLDESDTPLINEMSYGYDDAAVFKCPGHWDQNLEWHKGNMWPEEAHVEDFLKKLEG